MKRWTLRILLLLFLGAIVNVAVAWGCARFIEFSSLDGVYVVVEPESNSPSIQVTRAPCSEYAMGGTLVARFFVASMYLLDRDYSKNERVILEPSEYPLRWHHFESEEGVTGIESRGWPMLCMQWYLVRQEIRCGIDLGDDKRALVLSSPRGSRTRTFRQGVSARVLPLLPIWSGFAINTVFYASILFALCFGFGQGRRIIRLRRGRCPKCAYDLRGTESDVCSECGWRQG